MSVALGKSHFKRSTLNDDVACRNIGRINYPICREGGGLMSVALGMSSALNDDVAFRNMDIILLEYTLIALDTSHFEWSALNDVAFWTMEIILDCILVTLERPRSSEAVFPSQL